MSILEYPDKPSPHYQPKIWGRAGPSMCIGLVVFLLLLFGGYVIGMIVLVPLFDDIQFPTLPIDPVVLLIFLISFAIISSTFVILRGDMLYIGMGARFKEHDPSICRRVVRDGFTGKEYIISGSREDTFAEACKANWQFKSVSQKSRWYIKDEKGNDVTEKSLETTDGTFIIIPEYESEIVREERDETDEYSSIHDSVTYYD